MVVASTACAFACACAAGSALEPAPVRDTSARVAQPIATSSRAYAPPASEAWRREPPRSGPRPTPKLPAFRSAKLRNGLTVIVAEAHDQPLLMIDFVSPGGSAADPPLSPGLTFLTFSMLSGGSGGLTAHQFARQVEKAGAHSAAGSLREHAWFSLKGLSTKPEEIIKLLALAVTEPRLDERGLKDKKEYVAASIAGARGSLGTLAAQYLPALIYGGEHPFGHPAYGTPESIAAIDIQAVRQQYKRLVIPERSALILAGDITFERARALAEKSFGGWKPAPPPKPLPPRRAIPRVDAKRRRYVTILNRVNVAQTLVCLGRAIPGRNEPSELPLLIANELYGGAFASRLQMNLREDKGYTYDASSAVSFGEGAGELVACSSIKRSVTAKGVEEFLREMDAMRNAPIEPEAVQRQVAAYPLVLARGLETIEALAGLAISLHVRGRELDYPARLAGDLERLDPKAIDAVIAEYLRPEMMQILLVGDAEQLKKEIESLNLGSVIVLNR